MMLSTITYNTKDFLISTLNTLTFLGKLDYWEFIVHQPDTDDSKKHIHLIMFTSKTLNKSLLIKEFYEKDPDPNQTKPLCPHVINNTKDFGDWYWYALHNEEYLKSKLQTRNIQYNDSEIVCFDQNNHIQLVLSHPLVNYCKMSDMVIRQFVCDSVFNGKSISYILSSGYIPLQRTQSVILLYNALKSTIDYQAPLKIKSPQQLEAIKVDRFKTDLFYKIDNTLKMLDCDDKIFD